MRRDGPVLQPSGAPTYRVIGLLVGGGAIGRRLGYTGPYVAGPWLLKAVFSRLARRGRYVEWPRVAGFRDRHIVVRGDGRDLPQVPREQEQEALQ